MNKRATTALKQIYISVIAVTATAGSAYGTYTGFKDAQERNKHHPVQSNREAIEFFAGITGMMTVGAIAGVMAGAACGVLWPVTYPAFGYIRYQDFKKKKAVMKNSA
jgi:hypothetical protein